MNGFGLRVATTALVIGICSPTAAQQTAILDGHWLRQGIDASRRIDAGTAQSRDYSDETSVALYLVGLIEVHQVNNLTATIRIAASLKMSEDRHSPSKACDFDRGTAFALVPLLRLPQQISGRQAVAIVGKYLDQNPGKWQMSANHLATEALKQAFEPNEKK